MTARWYIELVKYDHTVAQIQRELQQLDSAPVATKYLRVQVQVSGYPLHNDVGMLHLALDWRFNGGPHMQQTMRLNEDNSRLVYTPIRLQRFELGQDRNIFVDMYLDDNRGPQELELRFELTHPGLDGPLIIPRQDV